MSKQIEPNEKTNLVLRVGHRVPFSGLICAVLAGVFFVGSKILVKKVPSVHPTVNVTIRGLIIMIFYGGISICKGLNLTGNTRKEFCGLIGRGFFGFLVCVTSYTALWRIPLGDSVTLLLTATVFTSILAKIFLKENFSLVNLVCLFLTMLGVVLIAEPPFIWKLFYLIAGYKNENLEYDDDKLVGIILTLVAAISFAFSYVILRGLRGVEVHLIVAYFGIFNFFGTLIALPIIKPFINNPETLKIPNTLTEWEYCMGITVCGLLGELFLTSAFQLEKANYIAILRTGDIIIAFVAESIFLSAEWATVKWTTLLGAGFILFSVVATTVYKSIADKGTDQDSLKKHQIISGQRKC